MDIQNRRAIQNKAAQSLAAAPGNPRKLVLLYAGGTAVLALVCSVIIYAIGLQINDTGGLGNLGLRTILSTVSMALPLAQAIIVLFLGWGYQNVVLRLARQQRCEPADLLEGFRRFGPLTRMMILQLCIYLALFFASMYLGSMIFVMTPFAADFIEIMMPLADSASMLTTQITLDEATLLAAQEAMLPMIPIVAVLFLIVAAPIMYQYRMSVFYLFDTGCTGALAAMQESRNMMKGNRVGLFKIDLHFWWFYALELLIAVLAYGDMLLPLVGVSFPWSDTVSYFLFYVLSLLAQTAVYYLFLNRVNVTYATVYEVLKPEPQEETRVPLGNIFNM